MHKRKKISNLLETIKMKKDKAWISDFFRILKLLVRKQLESLKIEGGISEEDFGFIVTYNSSTVSSDKIEIEIPRKKPEFTIESITYTEACGGLIGGILNQLKDFNEVNKELDPKEYGLFNIEDFKFLRIDLFMGIIFIRNLSLSKYFSVEVSKILESNCINTISNYFGADYVELYYQFRKNWIKAIENIDIPQLAISKIIVVRSNQRTGNKTSEAENWIKENAIAEVLVNTKWYYWPSIAMLTKLNEA